MWKGGPRYTSTKSVLVATLVLGVNGCPCVLSTVKQSRSIDPTPFLALHRHGAVAPVSTMVSGGHFQESVVAHVTSYASPAASFQSKTRSCLSGSRNQPSAGFVFRRFICIFAQEGPPPRMWRTHFDLDLLTSLHVTEPPTDHVCLCLCWENGIHESAQALVPVRAAEPLPLAESLGWPSRHVLSMVCRIPQALSDARWCASAIFREPLLSGTRQSVVRPRARVFE